mgnify:CR=1 FL=1
MQISKKYQVLINVNKEDKINEEFHKNIRLMLINHEINETVKLNVPCSYESKYFFQRVDFASFMNHIQNEVWLEEDLWFYTLNNASVFIDRVRNALVDIDENKVSEPSSDLTEDEQLEKFINLVKEDNSDIFYEF